MIAEILILLMQAPVAEAAAADEAPPTDVVAAEAEADVGVREKAIVSQISVDQARAARAEQLEIDKANGGKPAAVEQLPEDLELGEGEEGPEAHIVRIEQSPEERLYRDVAEVWETIRKRGQQPTPELIAREIGPDTLARFLDQNPGAAAAFGQDSDTLPVPGPEGIEFPDGSVFALPAPDAGA